jgi:hypothetical protein
LMIVIMFSDVIAIPHQLIKRMGPSILFIN